MQGTEGRPNGNDAGNVPPAPPGFSRGPGAGFPQGPTSMPPGGGIYYGQPTPYSPGDRPTAPYPLYQSPQQQPVASDEMHQAQQPTNHAVEPGVQGAPDQPISFPPQNANIPPGPPMAPQRPRKPSVFLPVLSIALLIAVIGGAVVWIQRDKVSEIDQLAVDSTFVDGKMVSCELGEELFDSLAWQDVFLPYDRDDSCSGWVETTEGDIRVDFSLQSETLEGKVSASAIETWEETTSETPGDPWCMMTTDDPAYPDLVLSVGASCEPLHPMARKLSDLSSIAAGEIPSDYGDDAVPARFNIIGKNYSKLFPHAVPIGTREPIESKDLRNATLNLGDISVSRFGVETVKSMDDEICVDAVLNVGEFKDKNAAEFGVPGLGVVNPAGQMVWLEQQKHHSDVEEYEKLDLTYCGLHTGDFRHATHLFVSYDEENDEFTPVWSFDIKGEVGI